ncbi:hypothetical protein F5884DRAFT_440481 [Xylogone sp. PMI_703]|nr:hypothetical protein F5884DRAFT_440481 [Xylogone sp. PMI_703]
MASGVNPRNKVTQVSGERKTTVPNRQLNSWRLSSAPRKQLQDSKRCRPNHQIQSKQKFKDPEANHGYPTDSAESPRNRQLIRTSSCCSINEIQSSVDPFCSLSKHLKRDSQQLLQFYLINMPERAYGIKPNAVFCPVREVSFAVAQTSPLTLEWMILTAESWLDALRGNQISLSTVRRRSAVYKLLQKSVLESSKPSDAVISGIIMAAIAESRISGPETAAVHFRGYEEAMRASKGLKKMIISSSASFPYTSHLMPYLLCQPMATDEVYREGATGSVWGILQLFAMGENSIEPSHLFYSVFPDYSLSKASSTRFELAPGISLYLTSGPFAPYLISASRIYHRYSEKTCHFAALFIIASTLWRISGDRTRLLLFFQRSDTLLQESSLHNTAGVNSLTMEGFMWLMIKTAFDVHESWSDKESTLNHQADVIVDLASALKLFRSCQESVKQELIYLFSNFLSGSSQFHHALA